MLSGYRGTRQDRAEHRGKTRCLVGMENGGAGGCDVWDHSRIGDASTYNMGKTKNGLSGGALPRTYWSGHFHLWLAAGRGLLALKVPGSRLEDKTADEA